MDSKAERNSKKKKVKFKIGKGDPQKGINFFNQAMTTGQVPTGMTGGVAEEFKERKQINILITIDFPYTPTAGSLAEDAIDEGNRKSKRDRFGDFVVNAMGHLERKGYEIFDEHPSDTPRSLSHYITTIKSDDLKGNDIKVMVFIRLSDHPMQRGGEKKRAHYLSKQANAYKTSTNIDKDQPWEDIRIIARGSSISDFGDAMRQFDKRLDEIDKTYYSKVDEAKDTEKSQKIERNLPKVKRSKDESLNEMSITRADAIDTCAGIGKKFVEHFDKIYHSNNKELIDHWAKEMDAWWDRAKKIKMASNNKIIRDVDLLNWFFDAGQLAQDFMTDDDIDEESSRYDELARKLLSREKTVVELINEMFPINESLNETTTSRVLQHLKGGEPWAIVSPYRSEYSDVENKHRMNQLKSEVRSMGYGFIHLVSRWVEDGIAFDEESLLIPRCIEDDAVALGKEYEQSSVIVSHDGKCVEICTNPFENYSEGQVVRTFNLNNDKPMNIRDAEEIFSKRKGGPVSKPKSKRAKPFTLKEVFVVEDPRASYFQNDKRIIEKSAGMNNRIIDEDAEERDFKNFSIEIPFEGIEVWGDWLNSGYTEVDYDLELDWGDFFDMAYILYADDDMLEKVADELNFPIRKDEDLDVLMNSQEFKNYIFDYAEEIVKNNLEWFREMFKEEAEDSAAEMIRDAYDNAGDDDYDDDYYGHY